MEPRRRQICHKKICHGVFLPITCAGHSVGAGIADNPQGNSSVHFCYQKWLKMLLLRAPDLHTYPLLKEGKIKYSFLDHLSSSGRVYFSDKHGKDTGSPWVIFFRTLVLKRYLSGHLMDDRIWLTLCCDSSVFCCCYINCMQPVPLQSAWDKTITKVVCKDFVCNSTVLTEFC